MTINFQHLRAFYAIGSDRSVSRAARRLNISQPTLSKQLKALEERYQTKLIEGARPPLTLTPAGAMLFEKARVLFGVADDIGALLGEAGSDDGGIIRLGTDSPPHAAEFMAAYLSDSPNAEFKVTVSNARHTNELLIKAQIDIALVCEPIVHSEYIYAPFYSDRLVAVVPADWGEVDMTAFDMDMLSNETLLLREPTSRTLSAINRLLTELNISPRRSMEMHTREMIREAVAQNIGISFMFQKECPPDSRIKLLDIKSRSKSIDVNGYLAVRTERRRLPAIRKALEISNIFARERGLL